MEFYAVRFEVNISKQTIHHNTIMAPQLAWIGLGNMGRVGNAGKKSYQMGNASSVNATPQNMLERVGPPKLFRGCEFGHSL